MQRKYLPQMIVISLTLMIFLVSTACSQSPTPTVNPRAPTLEPAVATEIWSTEYARATKAAAEFALGTDAAMTRKASGTLLSPTESLTPTSSRTPTGTWTRPPSETPTATDDPSKPTLTSRELETKQAGDPTIIKQRTDQAARARKALLVQGGPEDVPGLETPVQIVQADPTHLVYYLDRDFLVDKAPEAYLDLMPKYGWTLKPGGVLRNGNATTLTFVKQGRTATVTISLEPDRRVKVAIEIKG